jgi:hypothetical protein
MNKIYPFKFLDAYTSADKDIFFGRDNEINELYELVLRSNLLLIYGASGTGKTSLIQCGLAGRFQSHEWLALNVRRGVNLPASLMRAIEDAGGTLVEEELDWLNDDFTAEKVEKKQLSPLAQKIRTVYLQSFKPIYFIFDQFEELFILGNKEEQAEFIVVIKELLEIEQPVKLIISVREEYLGLLYELEKEIPDFFKSKLRVEPMNLSKVQSVLKGISKLESTLLLLEKNVENELCEQIFEKVKGKDKSLTIQLPYLQVFLDKFYLSVTNDESRQTTAVFTLEALKKTGDMDNVLREFLDEQVVKIAKKLDIAQEEIWTVLKQFVTLEGTKEPISEAALLARLNEYDEAKILRIISAFTNGRILRYSENEGLYEIMHDTLAKQIAGKRTEEETAILEVQRLIKTQSHMTGAAKAHFTEAQLVFIEPFIQSGKIRLDKEEAVWIRESQENVAKIKKAEIETRETKLREAEAREAEARKNAKKQSRLYRIASGIAVFACLTAVTSFIFYFQARESQKRAEENQIRANQEMISAFQALIMVKKSKISSLKNTINTLKSAGRAEDISKLQDTQNALEKDIKNYVAEIEKIQKVELNP